MSYQTQLETFDRIRMLETTLALLITCVLRGDMLDSRATAKPRRRRWLQYAEHVAHREMEHHERVLRGLVEDLVRGNGTLPRARAGVEQLERDFRDRTALYADIDASPVHGVPESRSTEAAKETAIEVRAPLALHIAAQNIPAALSVNGPSVGAFRPIGFSATCTRRTRPDASRFFEAAWQRQEQGKARRQLTRLFMWSMAVKGEGILKTLERTHAVWRLVRHGF